MITSVLKKNVLLDVYLWVSIAMDNLYSVKIPRRSYIF